jgi:hypothetical protein
MIIKMNDSKLNRMAQMESFLAKTEAVEFSKKFKK